MLKSTQKEKMYSKVHKMQKVHKTLLCLKGLTASEWHFASTLLAFLDSKILVVRCKSFS
jgi:hypothetical protein